MRVHTFGIGPVGIQVRQSCLVTDLLEGLGGLMVDLEDTARPPPAATRVAISHVEVDTSTTATASASSSITVARRVVARVKGDGTLEKNWGRQLGGVAGVGR